jgi:hypothetical protein
MENPKPEKPATEAETKQVELIVSDVKMTERDGGYCPPQVVLAVAAVDSDVLKKKRGRPTKGLPKSAPPPKQKKEDEDVCFICFDGGSLVLCDRR